MGDVEERCVGPIDRLLTDRKYKTVSRIILKKKEI